MKKDTLYIDIDDDITALIDRVKSSKQPIVAMVLPKRAQMLHSSVNMRLLKRAADDEKKRLVLITTEAPIVKLAGGVGVYVAKSLTSKPVIPKVESEEPETVEVDDEDTSVDKDKSVGELAGVAAVAGVATAKAADGDEETIELDNDDKPDEGKSEELKTEKTKKDRKLKVPNFDKFRLWLFGGGGLAILLIILGFFAFFVWPKATITIKTESRSIDSKIDFSTNTALTEKDEANKILPSQMKEIKQTATEKIVATGSKDIGSKAKGYVTLYNCNKGLEPVTMPAGSRLIVGSAVFLTDAAVTVPASTFNGFGTCLKNQSRDVNVTSQLGGGEYNLSARSGYTAPDFIDISGFGSNMTGGTSNVVKAVSADDVEQAKQKMLLRNTDEVKAQLADQLKTAGQYPIDATFVGTPGNPVSTPAVGEQATDATVTMEFTYQMTGVKQSDLDDMLKKNQEPQIDTSKEKIYNNGLDKAKFSVLERKSPAEIKLNLATTATVGPQLDADAIAKEVAGKKAGEAKQIIESRPGIASAEISYSPFYVLSIPKRTSHITIQFDVEGEIQ